MEGLHHVGNTSTEDVFYAFHLAVLLDGRRRHLDVGGTGTAGCAAHML